MIYEQKKAQIKNQKIEENLEKENQTFFKLIVFWIDQLLVVVAVMKLMIEKAFAIVVET